MSQLRMGGVWGEAVLLKGREPCIPSSLLAQFVLLSWPGGSLHMLGGGGAGGEGLPLACNMIVSVFPH